MEYDFKKKKYINYFLDCKHFVYMYYFFTIYKSKKL